MEYATLREKIAAEKAERVNRYAKYQEIIDQANRYAMDDEMQVIKYFGILTDIINAHPDITREEILYEINRIKEILL